MTDIDTTTIPMTVISGPLGAGKTTLVNRLLNHPGDNQIAVIVNDMGEVNIDAELLEEETDDGIVDLSNGCICCRLQDDLVTEAKRLADERSFDYLVIEASGISEPIPIAKTLTTGAESGSLGDRFYVDTTVSVIDAYGFWKAFDVEESIPDAAPDPERPLSEVLIDQIEFCDVLLLNKCDMVPDVELEMIMDSIQELQPRAAIHRTTYSEVNPQTVLDTGRFDFEEARRQQGWKQALSTEAAESGDNESQDRSVEKTHNHDHDHGESAAAAHNVESFVYRQQNPFNPEQFDTWLSEWNGDIIRMKGFAWVSTRPETVLGVSQAGSAVQAGPIGEWGQDDPATRLVVIGQQLDMNQITAELDDCVIDNLDERAQKSQDDPFPRES
jgi:Putative GTPases (G3E family)